MHIADAPCHGSIYHSVCDDYPAGDKDDLTHEQMRSGVRDIGIDYCFGYIDKENTDKMISIFSDFLQQISQCAMVISSALPSVWLSKNTNFEEKTQQYILLPDKKGRFYTL